jgi:hypothetical protein
MRKKTVENCYLKLAFIKPFPWKIHNKNCGGIHAVQLDVEVFMSFSWMWRYSFPLAGCGGIHALWTHSSILFK